MRRRLQLLAEASADFAEATLDPARLMETVARRITGAVGDSCAILLREEGSQELRPVAFFHTDQEARALGWRLLTESPIRLGEGFLGRAAQSEKPLLVPELDPEELIDDVTPEYRPLLRKYPAHTLMVVPLMARGRCLGVLGMARHDTSPAPYTEDDLRLALDLAERAAMAMEVAQLVERERAVTERALALADASKAIQTLDHEEAISNLVRVGAKLVGDGCVVTLVEEGVLKTKFGAHRDPAADAQIQRLIDEPLPTDRGAPAQCVKENRSIRIEDARGYRAALQSSEDYRRSVGIDSILICPLRVGQTVIGTLGVSRDAGGGAYTQEDEMFLQELADRAALVVHNARLYEAAEAARREAEKASEHKDEFLSAASHELRTPITTLQIMLQTTLRHIAKDGRRRPVDPEWLLPRLEKADKQARRLVSLIDDLLEVSSISAGHVWIHAEDMNICELVRAVAARFEEPAAEAKCALTVVAPPALNGLWDRSRLDQVVTNLMTNALKYGRGQPVTLTVSGSEAAARIAVADSGIGVAPENHERIFERFERAESVRNYGGFGIGLWIVREIVRGMGGSVRVESQPGQGATFIVELPR